MAFSGNHICTSYLVELLTGNIHIPASHTWKLALYGADATLNADTTAYSATNEVSGSGYSAGGIAVTPATPTSGGRTAFLDIADATFSSVTVSARGALLYNSSSSNRAILVLDFGRLITKTAEDLVVRFPTADQLNAIIRLAAKV